MAAEFKRAEEAPEYEGEVVLQSIAGFGGSSNILPRQGTCSLNWPHQSPICFCPTSPSVLYAAFGYRVVALDTSKNRVIDVVGTLPSNVVDICCLDNGNVVAASQYQLFLVNPQDGSSTVLAGSGNSGTCDATGQAAQFQLIVAVATCSNNSVFVLQGNHVLRLVTARGVVTTIVGVPNHSVFVDGIGTTARIQTSAKFGLCVDRSTDCLLFAGHCRIRKVSRGADGTHTVKTVAGTGTSAHGDARGTAAQLRGVQGMAATRDGHVLFLDSSGSHSSVRCLSPAGDVTTVLGFPNESSAEWVDGPATIARIRKVSGIATNGHGLVVISSEGRLGAFCWPSSNGNGGAAVPPPRLAHDLRQLLTSAELGDVTLTARDGTEFHSSRSLLAIRCPHYFGLMLRGGGDKSQGDSGGGAMLEATTGSIQLSNTSSAAAAAALTYLHTDQLELPQSEQLLEVLHLAEQWQLPRLKALCEARLSQCMSAENVCLFLTQAHLLQAATLRERCLQFAANHFGRVREQLSGGLSELDKQLLLDIMLRLPVN